jgi:hypothetical protein
VTVGKWESRGLGVRNGVYGALLDYGAFLDTTQLPAMNLPGIDFVSIAAGYGLPGRRVNTAADMADALKAAIDTGKPSLLEVEVAPADSGMFKRSTYDLERYGLMFHGGLHGNDPHHLVALDFLSARVLMNINS